MLRLLRSTAFRVVFTAAVLVVLARSVDMRQAAASLVRESPVWFLLSLALVAADRVVMAVRWLLLLRASAVRVSFGTAVHIFLVSSFVGSFLPAGVGADAARAYSLAARTAQGSEAVASVAIDRLLGLMAIIALGGIGIVVWAQRLDPGLRLASTIFGAVAALATIGMFWIDRVLGWVMPPAWRSTRWAARLLRLGEAIGRYRGRPGALLAVLALSVGVQVLRVLQAYCLGRGLDIPVGLLYYFVFMPVALLVLLLPVSVSGFGLPQGVMVGLLEQVSVPRADSFALSTLIVVIALIGNLPGAWLYLRARRP